jgi:type-F conjugative transfer system secretin TraK
MTKGLIVLLCLLSFTVNAFQVKTAEEGILLDFDISDQELTHISIENDRITGIKSAFEGLTIDREEERGHVFIRVNGIYAKPIQAFILTESGKTIGVRLTPQAIPSETIKIKPYEEVPLQNAASSEEIILDLIDSLHHQNDLEKISSLDTLETIEILGMTAIETARLVNQHWLAFEYSLQNTHPETVELLESDFATSSVYAVAIQNKILRPNETTKIYVVKKH